MIDDDLELGGVRLKSRLLTGTGKFSDRQLIPRMLAASGSRMITVALRRVDLSAGGDNILDVIPDDVTLLPNTSGARTADEAVRIACIARAAGCGDFIKIEVITDNRYLMPDGIETLAATEILAKEGFIVLPYVVPDLTLARRLEDAGAAAVMPLGAPIGSNQGFKSRDAVALLVDCCRVPVIVDAGLGRPSHAAEAMEMGVDAVLVNTAIATAPDPVAAGEAFALAVRAGRMAFTSRMPAASPTASASSPLTGFLR